MIEYYFPRPHLPGLGEKGGFKMAKPKMTAFEAQERAENLAFQALVGSLAADANREALTDVERVKKKYARSFLKKIERWRKEKMKQILEEYDIEG